MAIVIRKLNYIRLKAMTNIEVNSNKSTDYDVFIAGETIDLCAPTDEEKVLNQWYKWFNQEDTTKYLAQGVRPNTQKLQKAYYESLLSDPSRIALLIKPKKYDGFVGVASLSHIDHVQRQCDFAMVIGNKLDGSDSLFFGLEAKCRMTQHAMEKLGVERINSTQAIDLLRWQNWQILFGYQIEGVLRNKFRKGRNVYDVLISSCILEDYEELLNLRGNDLWPGKQRIFEMLRRLTKPSMIDELIEWLPVKQQEYWDKILTATDNEDS